MNTIEVPVLTVDEAAQYLWIPKSSLRKLAHEGEMPIQKGRRHWRFHWVTIARWYKDGDLPPQLIPSTSQPPSELRE